MKKHDHVVVDKENKIMDCNTRLYLNNVHYEQIRLGNYILMPYVEYEKKRLVNKR